MNTKKLPTAIPTLAFTVAVVLFPFTTGAQQSTAQPTPVEPQKGSATSVAVPIYKPPVRGAPGGRVGGGTRGKDQTFTLSVLAPNHTGLTSQEQPVLYWYISKPISAPIVFTLSDDDAKPLVEQVLTPPFTAGVQRLRLADFGTRLASGKQYQWYVGLIPDSKRRSKDILAGATIERAGLPEPVASRISKASVGEVIGIYAETGHWYDAMAILSDLIEANPSDVALRSQRVALMRQVGLNDIAEYDMSLK
jgi:hypothetical protein